MMNGGSDAVQVMYMEVEGIKLAYQVSKDAARLAKQLMTFLIRAMMDAPYRKVSGKTNIKNLKSRSNGQAMVAVTVNKKIYRKLQKDAKKYGILYHAFEPLKSGKKDSVELIIAEKDLSMLQELLSRYKNEQIKEDVKCGLSKEQSERNYEENNRTETMEEFTNNVGAATSEETFDKDMKERFGEDYQGKVIDYVKASKKIDPKAHTAGVDQKKVGTLAEVIQFRDRAERQLGKVCRKTAMRLVDGGEKRVNVTPDSLRELLGVVRYQDGVHSTRNQVGVVNGLAWTEVGGEILEVEAGVMEGSGKLELTGNLGTVMQESVRAALTCLRSRCGELGIEKDFYKTRDIHVHFPEGAVPKDGPSAGIAITTAMLSALTGRKVRGDVAMTGEVTLRGRVLPIGGLKEKTMAALRSGIRTVILPKDNVKDLEEIDQTVRAALHFVPVESVDQVFAAALVPSPAVSAVEHMTALPMEPAAPALRV